MVVYVTQGGKKMKRGLIDHHGPHLNVPLRQERMIRKCSVHAEDGKRVVGSSEGQYKGMGARVNEKDDFRGEPSAATVEDGPTVYSLKPDLGSV